MKWSIHSFKPYKSPGPDGITPAHIQQAGQIAINWLKKIFQSILAVGELPTAWQETKVVFIPKAGKATHTTVGSYSHPLHNIGRKHSAAWTSTKFDLAKSIE